MFSQVRVSFVTRQQKLLEGEISVGKRRNRQDRKRIHRATVAGTVAATAAALTMGLTAPAAGAASALEAQNREIALAALPDDLAGLNLGAVLSALGINVPGIDNLIPTDIPGLKLITTGPPFGALGILGLNPTWVPANPDMIADEINSTEYVPLDLGVSIPGTFILLPLTDAFTKAPFNLSNAPLGFRASRAALALCGVDGQLCGVPEGGFPVGIPNLRVPTVIGFGIGSLATGQAWDQVVADLPNQPGGTAEGAEDGRSLTIVNMILLRNPGRADGGIAARFQPILGLFGFNGLTPDFEVERDGDAVLVPNKVDATVEYDPISDFAAWPNPFTLANNGAAFLFPTYILRGSEDSIPEMLAQIFGALLPGVAGNIAVGAVESLPTDFVIRPEGGTLNVPCSPLGCGLSSTSPLRAFAVTLPDGGISINVREAALAGFGDVIEEELGIEIPDDYFPTNTYLTFRQNSLPLLEPFRYPTDFANLLTGGAFGFTNPFADAVEPALKILVNLGYTNVTQDMSNPLDPYPRDFSGNFGSEYAPFFTFPENVDWGQVPGDLATAFAAGVQSAFFSGGIPGVNPGVPVANPLAIIAGLLGLDGGIPELPNLLNAFPELGDIIGGNLGLPDLNSASTLAAAAAPAFGGGSDDPLTRLGETLARTLHIAFEREAPVEYTPPTSPVDSAFDVGEGLSASGLRLLAATVLGPTRLAALAEGGPEALADLIVNTVDAPLWVADPALYGLRDGLPEDLADNVTQFRDRLWALTEEINEALLGALDDLPNAPADVRIANDDTQAGVDDPEIKATLRAAGSVPTGQPAGEVTSDLPPADGSTVDPGAILEEEESTAPKSDKKVTNGGQIKGGQLSKSIERSIDRVGDRLNDAADDLRDGIKKALTPPSRSTTVDNDPADTGGEPAE